MSAYLSTCEQHRIAEDATPNDRPWQCSRATVLIARARSVPWMYPQMISNESGGGTSSGSEVLAPSADRTEPMVDRGSRWAHR